MQHKADHRVPVLVVGGSPGGPVPLPVPGPSRRTAPARRAAFRAPRSTRVAAATTCGRWSCTGWPASGSRTSGRRPRSSRTTTASCRPRPWSATPGMAVQAHRPGRRTRAVQPHDLVPVQPERPRTGAAEGGPRTRRGPALLHEMEGFEQDPEGVTAFVRDRDSDTLYTVRADYLVACDGPRSPVRRRLDIGQSGPGDLFANVSVTFPVQAARRHGRRPPLHLLLPHQPRGRRRPCCPSTTRSTGSSTPPGTRSRARRWRSSPRSGSSGTSGWPSASPTSMWRSPARRPGAPRNASPSGTRPAGSCSPATPPTRCPRPAPSARTPASRTPTTWPGSWPPSLRAGPGPVCWTPTTPSAGRSPWPPAPGPRPARWSTATPASRPCPASAAGRAAASSRWSSPTAIRRAPSWTPTPPTRSYPTRCG